MLSFSFYHSVQLTTMPNPPSSSSPNPKSDSVPIPQPDTLALITAALYKLAAARDKPMLLSQLKSNYNKVLQFKVRYDSITQEGKMEREMKVSKVFEGFELNISEQTWKNLEEAGGKEVSDYAEGMEALTWEMEKEVEGVEREREQVVEREE